MFSNMKYPIFSSLFMCPPSTFQYDVSSRKAKNLLFLFTTLSLEKQNSINH